ncbi:transposase-like protein [Deinococcus sp. UYEF24]
MLADQKLSGYRFPLSVISHAVWLYHRYAMSYWDVEELLFERGIEVSREFIRTWCINFSDEFAQHLPGGVLSGIWTRSGYCRRIPASSTGHSIL